MNAIVLAAVTLSVGSLVNVVIWVVVVGLIWWLLNWLVGYCAVPEPFAKVARVILAVLAVLLLINALLMLAGHPILTW